MRLCTYHLHRLALHSVLATLLATPIVSGWVLPMGFSAFDGYPDGVASKVASTLDGYPDAKLDYRSGTSRVLRRLDLKGIT